MKKYQVEFTIPARIEVECDNEQDAQEFVANVGTEQLLRWSFCGSQNNCTRYVQIIAVKEIDNKQSS
jgi:hypothetical protein